MKALQIILIWLVFYVFIIAVVYFHEVGHKEINSVFGIESEIEIYNFGFSGRTISNVPQCSVINTTYCIALKQTHAQHEAASYTFLPIIVLVGAIIVSVFTMQIIFGEN